MMTRPLFDPEKMSGPPTASKGRDDGPMTVSAAAALIAGVLDRNLPSRLRIVGEISGFNDRTHWYFRLKDENAVLDCVMFQSAGRRTGFRPADGMKVILTGRVEFYAKQGRTQFYAEAMEPVGAGALEQRFRALCAELKGLGWFDVERKRRLPLFPRRVAVVTSRTGAALQDVLATARRRCPAVAIALVDVRVQGDGAAEEIAGAIRWLSAERAALGIDAILVTRGGGSIEDLWAFNERVVAEAIVGASLPVVAAIGHETDTTIAELVADVRAATPTQAAMLLIPDRAALAEEVEQKSRRLWLLLSRRIEQWGERLRGLLRRAVIADPRGLLDRPGRHAAELERRLAHAAGARVSSARVRLERLTARLAQARPAAMVAARRARTEGVALRLDRAMALGLERGRTRIDALERELVISGPARVLARGYSITTTEDGRVVRRRGDAAPGATITTRVADGTFRSVVEGAGEPAGVAGHDVPRRRKVMSRDGSEQMGLF